VVLLTTSQKNLLKQRRETHKDSGVGGRIINTRLGRKLVVRFGRDLKKFCELCFTYKAMYANGRAKALKMPKGVGSNPTMATKASKKEMV
jgi:hypothetical protein